MNMTKRGNEGEALARGYLEGLGYSFVRGQFRIRGGEIDLIMKDGEFVFVEVKLRSTNEYGSGLESIGYANQSFLRRAAHAFISQRDIENSWRIDVITIDVTAGEPIFEHIPSAIGEN